MRVPLRAKLHCSIHKKDPDKSLSIVRATRRCKDCPASRTGQRTPIRRVDCYPSQAEECVFSPRGVPSSCIRQRQSANHPPATQIHTHSRQYTCMQSHKTTTKQKVRAFEHQKPHKCLLLTNCCVPESHVDSWHARHSKDSFLALQRGGNFIISHDTSVRCLYPFICT
jgi:hypothetical protein